VTPRAVRRIVLLVCAGGIAGMIVSSIADNNGAAMTAGLMTAVAVLCLIVTTAVTTPTGPTGPTRLTGQTAGAASTAGAAAETGVDGYGEAAELAAADVEAAVVEVVEQGADEAAVRDLVGRAVRLGRLRAR